MADSVSKEEITKQIGVFSATNIDNENIVELDDPESIPEEYYKEMVGANDTYGIYGETNKTGWYYDYQRNNPITSIRLFTNTKFNGTDWVNTKDRKYSVWLRSCDSILAEDFKIQINNSWSDAGNDIISNSVNQALSAVAPYRKLIGDGLTELKQRKDKYKADNKEKTENSTIFKGIDWTVDKADEFRTDIKNFLGVNTDSDIDDILNSRLVTQGTQYTYYGGTGVDFGNLDMRFTIFPKINSKGEFQSTVSQVTELYPYFVGRLIDFKDSKLSGKDKAEGSKGNIFTDVLESEVVNKYFKVQLPPGGYQAENEVIDVGISGVGLRGTFELRIGAFYKVNNLVITGVSLNFSKQMVKNPLVSNGKEDLISCDISPLFCDVALTFKPASKYSNEALMKFVNGDNAKTISSQLKTNLTNLQKNSNKIYK